MEAASPGSVLEHRQYQGVTTSEPRTLNLEPIILGRTYLEPSFISREKVIEENKVLVAKVFRISAKLFLGRGTVEGLLKKMNILRNDPVGHKCNL